MIDFSLHNLTTIGSVLRGIDAQYGPSVFLRSALTRLDYNASCLAS